MANPRNRKSDEARITDGTETPSSMDDSASDEERLKQDVSYIILPEVSDIPGQENINNIGSLGEMADTTIASDDEEGIQDGKDLLANDDEEAIEIVMGTEADVTKEDLMLLGDKDKDMDMGDDELISNEGLDDTDFDGEPLNENVADMNTTGYDLDTTGVNDDNPANSALGQGDDEENNYYSLGNEDEDNTTDGTS